METVTITVERLEELLEAKVRLDIIKKAIEQEEYITSNDLRRKLGMEVKKDVE